MTTTADGEIDDTDKWGVSDPAGRAWDRLCKSRRGRSRPITVTVPLADGLMGGTERRPKAGLCAAATFLDTCGYDDIDRQRRNPMCRGVLQYMTGVGGPTALWRMFSLLGPLSRQAANY